MGKLAVDNLEVSPTNPACVNLNQDLVVLRMRRRKLHLDQPPTLTLKDHRAHAMTKLPLPSPVDPRNLQAMLLRQ